MACLKLVPLLNLGVFVCMLQISEGQYTVRKAINTNLAPSLPAVFSQAIQIDNLVYVSGNVGLDVNFTLAEGIVNQTRLAMDNIGHILGEANSSYDNIIKVTVLLTDINDYTVMNEIYAEYFTTDKLPARSAYQVAKLPFEALVEIEVVAISGEIIDVK